MNILKLEIRLCGVLEEVVVTYSDELMQFNVSIYTDSQLAERLEISKLDLELDLDAFIGEIEASQAPECSVNPIIDAIVDHCSFLNGDQDED